MRALADTVIYQITQSSEREREEGNRAKTTLRPRARNQIPAAEYAAAAGARAARTAGAEGVRRKVSFASVSFEAEFWNEAWGGQWCEGAKITLKQRKKGGKAVIEWHNDHVAILRISVQRQFLPWV